MLLAIRLKELGSLNFFKAGIEHMIPSKDRAKLIFLGQI
jgi:hypothetical protein